MNSRVPRLLTRASICSRCLLHTSSANAATPVAHPTIPGPPPQAPRAAVTYAQDRVARKRQQADILRQAQQAKVNPAKPQTALQKRFWKEVSVQENEDGSLHVLLDKRPVRTAQRQVLAIPGNKRALATSIALEWDHLVSAQQALKQHYIPLTSLTSRAVDIAAADEAAAASSSSSTPDLSANPIRSQLVTVLMRYLSTDTLLCWAPEHDRHSGLAGTISPTTSSTSSDSSTDPRTSGSLRQRQRATAAPILAYLTAHVFPGVEIVPVLGEDSIVPVRQPAATREVIRAWIAGLPAFELAALERGVLATKSLLVAARLVVEWSREWEGLRKNGEEGEGAEKGTGRFGIDEAAEAATLEVMHQTEMWGEVEDTHDVEREDLRRQLGSVILLVS